MSNWYRDMVANLAALKDSNATSIPELLESIRINNNRRSISALMLSIDVREAVIKNNTIVSVKTFDDEDMI